MSQDHLCVSTDQLPALAAGLLEEYADRRVFAFFGAMGAGKTTFIQTICETLGVSDTVNSPTFAIINEYFDGRQQPVYHFDFYRINTIIEALDIGYENYFYSGHYCFIEWPEKILELLPEKSVYVKIEETGPGGERVIRY